MVNNQPGCVADVPHPLVNPFPSLRRTGDRLESRGVPTCDGTGTWVYVAAGAYPTLSRHQDGLRGRTWGPVCKLGPVSRRLKCACSPIVALQRGRASLQAGLPAAPGPSFSTSVSTEITSWGL